VARTWRVRGRRREAPRRGTRASGRAAAARYCPGPPRQPSAIGWASVLLPPFLRRERAREEDAAAAAVFLLPEAELVTVTA
jgi:hypothetical protein